MQTIRLDPKHEIAYENLGSLLVDRGEHQEAIVTRPMVLLCPGERPFCLSALG
jgi:hypothetical protein